MNVYDAIEMATAVAKDVYNYKSKHGAVIISESGELISIGHNMKKHNRRNYLYGYSTPYDHAEANAIFKALSNPKLIKKLKGSTLIVVRIGKTKLKNSYPCKHCIELATTVGISKIMYSNVRGNIGSLSL